MTDSTHRPRPEVDKVCPYCGAPQMLDKLHTRLYECGTRASRDTGQYSRKCSAGR